MFEALAGINRQGFVYYEWRRGYERIELDFAVWIPDLGRFARQVKGGRYLLIDGDWHLKTRAGVRAIYSCPLDETKIAALDLHDDIQELAETVYNPFVLPIIVFPDMERDEAIDNLAQRNLAQRKGVYSVWGTKTLAGDLERVVHSRSVSPDMATDRMADEVYAVTDGLIRLDKSSNEAAADAAGKAGLATDGRSRGVIRVTIRGTNVIAIRFHVGGRRSGERTQIERGPEK